MQIPEQKNVFNKFEVLKYENIKNANINLTDQFCDISKSLLNFDFRFTFNVADDTEDFFFYF